MRQSIHLRNAPQAAHPPYGLYVDPHRNQHSLWSVDPRALLGFLTVLGSLGAFLSMAAS